MTNREIFESLKTAKWEIYKINGLVLAANGKDWKAYIGRDGGLYLSGAALTDGYNIPHGVVPEVDEVVLSAMKTLVDDWNRWLDLGSTS